MIEIVLTLSSHSCATTLLGADNLRKGVVKEAIVAILLTIVLPVLRLKFEQCHRAITQELRREDCWKSSVIHC